MSSNYAHAPAQYANSTSFIIYHDASLTGALLLFAKIMKPQIAT